MISVAPTKPLAHQNCFLFPQKNMKYFFFSKKRESLEYTSRCLSDGGKGAYKTLGVGFRVIFCRYSFRFLLSTFKAKREKESKLKMNIYYTSGKELYAFFFFSGKKETRILCVSFTRAPSLIDSQP